MGGRAGGRRSPPPYSCRYNSVEGRYCQATEVNSDCRLCYTPEAYENFTLAPEGLCERGGMERGKARRRGAGSELASGDECSSLTPVYPCRLHL